MALKPIQIEIAPLPTLGAFSATYPIGSGTIQLQVRYSKIKPVNIITKALLKIGADEIQLPENKTLFISMEGVASITVDVTVIGTDADKEHSLEIILLK